MTAEQKKTDRISKTFRISHGMLHVSGISCQGTGRTMNQDRYTATQIGRNGFIAAVADGMGGHAGGNIAAETAVRGIAGINTIREGHEMASLIQAIKKIDDDILAISIRQPVLKGMGTTLTAVFIDFKKVHFVHVGDSRLYLYRDGEVNQITRDQTLAEFLLKAGEITKGQIFTHYSQHILEQCVGHGECKPQTGAFPVEANDLLLLSSDGLHKILENDLLASLLRPAKDLDDTRDLLVEKALSAGGTDDITLVLIYLAKRISQTPNPG